jgi:hypothetical protein
VFLDQHPYFAQRLGDFVTKLKRKDFVGTLISARETLELIQATLDKQMQWDSPIKLLLGEDSFSPSPWPWSWDA